MFNEKFIDELTLASVPLRDLEEQTTNKRRSKTNETTTETKIDESVIVISSRKEL